MKKIELLLVDDNTLFRDTVKQLLSSQSGLEIEIVGEAEDAEDAVKKAQELMPGVILMDISLPKMNGLEATRYIKEHYPAIKVIILTVHDNEAYREEARRSKASHYLVKKDLTPESLTATIRNVTA